MDFVSKVLTEECTLGDMFSSMELKQKAVEIEKLRNERNDLYFKYMKAYFRYMQTSIDESRSHQEKRNNRRALQLQHQQLQKITEDLSLEFSSNTPHFLKDKRICLAFQTLLLGELKSMNDNPIHFKLDDKNSRISEQAFREYCLAKLNDEFVIVPKYVHIIPPAFFYDPNLSYEGIFPGDTRGDMRDFSYAVLNYFAESDSQKELLKDLRQEKLKEDAVSEVCETFAKWGRDKSLRMFILSISQYKNYIKRENLIPTQSLPRNVDVLIMCEQVGIVFLQVKSCTVENDLSSIHGTIHTALEQLVQCTTDFLECNRDLNFLTLRLPTWVFVAMPYLSEQKMNEVQLCSYHKKLILWREKLAKVELDFIKIHYTIPFWTCQQFRYISARYICVAGSTKTLPKAIETTSRLMSKHLSSEFVLHGSLLNKKTPYQVVKGGFGTGKTFLLCKKAQVSLAEYPYSKVIFVICMDLDKYDYLITRISTFPLVRYVENLLTNGKDHQKNRHRFEVLPLNALYAEYCESKGKTCGDGTVITAEFFQTLLEMIMEENVNLFIDELPVKFFDQSQGALIKLAQRRKTNLVWVALATHSFYRYYPSSQRTNNQVTDSFQCTELVHNKRNSGSILKLMKHIAKYANEEGPSPMSGGLDISGPKSLFFRVEKCHCTTDVDKTKHGIFCLCLEKRLTKTLKFVLKRLGILKIDDERVLFVVQHIFNSGFISSIFRKLETLFESVFHSLGLEKMKFQWLTLAKKHSESCAKTFDPTKIKMFDWGTFIGCESEIVINIDFFAMSQWLPNNELFNGSTMVLSRCTSQYVHIALQGDEVETFIRQHIDMFRSHVDKHRYEHCPEPYHDESIRSIDRFIKKMQNFVPSKENLLRELLEEGLLVEELIPDEGALKRGNKNGC